ncbi:MAG: hypothetical protein JW715_01270 [Sedimentisphaerales bacterium]|nr:hypothetical protein [Sedimentisphaerales bacterium]
MKKRLMHYLITGLVLLSVFSILIACYWEEPLFMYYYFTSESPPEIPECLIKTAFQRVTGHGLPKNVADLRAIYQGGRDREIFVKFQTDSNGIEYIRTTFGKTPSKYRKLDSESMKTLNKSGLKIFTAPSIWQDDIGADIFNQKSITSGCILEYPAELVTTLGYKIFIDETQNIVYMYAYER